MQLKGILLLLTFSWCILTPIVITICDINTDISVLFSMNEEETQDGYNAGAKEIKTHLVSELGMYSIFELQPAKNFFSQTQLWNPVSIETTSPPPEPLG